MGLHRRAALAACLAVFLGWLAVYSLQVEERLLAGTNDFLQLYAGAKLARSPQLYEAEASWQVHRQAVGIRLPSVVHTRPPFYSFLLQPLGQLPYRAAYWTFLAVNFLGLAWFCWRFFSHRPAYALLVACFPPLYVAILGGNDLGLVLALLGSAMLLMDRDRDFLAGLLLSLCAIKFHLFILLPPVLLLLGRRRVLAGGLTGGTALLALSFFSQGLDWPIRYLALLRNPVIHPLGHAMPNLQGLVRNLLPGAYFAATLVLTAAAAAAVLWLAWRRRRDWRYGFALALLGGLLVSWHCYVQDAVLLLPVLALLLQTSTTSAVKFPLAIALIPFPFWMLAASAPWPAVPALLLCAVLAGAVWESRRSIAALPDQLTESNLAPEAPIHST